MDETHPNSCLVKILRFTPNEMFATVYPEEGTEADSWETMTNRLAPNFELQYCSNCIQMTNHINNECQKCKANAN